MKPVSKTFLLIAVTAIAIGFFLPWVHVESKQIGTLSKLITGKGQENIAAISGFQIPVMANGEESRLIISVAQIFNPGVKNADKKSFLVWLVPILAMIIFGLVSLVGSNKWLHIIYGAVGLLIFIFAVYKIKTTDLDKLVLQIKIGFGFWLIIWGYLALGLYGLINFLSLSKKES